MNRTLMTFLALLVIGRMPLQAGDSGKTTIQAAVGASPRAEDTRQVMIQTAVVPVKPEEEKKPKPPPAVRAADWIAAWQAAKEACPDASGMKIYYADRSGPTLESLKVFECVDMKARGELLVITIKKAGQNEDAVAIVRASDVVRIDISKPKTTP